MAIAIVTLAFRPMCGITKTLMHIRGSKDLASMTQPASQQLCRTSAAPHLHDARLNNTTALETHG